MPTVSLEDFVPWVNYHLSVGEAKGSDLEPQLQVERLGRLFAADLEGLGIERFAATAAALSAHLEKIRTLLAYKAALGQLGAPPKPFPLALTGRGWSFSDIIGARAGEPCPAMLVLDGLSSVLILGQNEKAPAFAQTDIALVGGGTRLRELAEIAARRGLSILNSGTHLGTTVAGAIGTASHGARLGHGGLQNMVHGLHLVTGIGEHVWLERKSRPILAGAAVAQLGGQGAVFRHIQDDRMFEDALVHLGCMGIVNAVAVELEPAQTFEEIRLDRGINAQWLAVLAAGKWASIGESLGRDVAPVFYELTIDPHAWNGPSAAHLAFFPAAGRLHLQPAASQPAGLRTFADAASDLASQALLSRPTAAHKKSWGETLALLDRPVPMKSFFPFGDVTERSTYEYYRNRGFFSTAGTSRLGQWKDLHGDEITGGYPGALWNASYAIQRQHLPRAIPAICAATRDLPRSFVFTVRFVSNAAGTLAFTRFPETAVIEIDGLSPWICRKVARRWIGGNAGTTAGIEAELELLSAIEQVLPLGAARVTEALHRAGIDHSSHWAKLGSISPAAVHAAFGDPADPSTPLGCWRATREALLPSPLARAIFWNSGAVRMGLLERPLLLP